MTTQAPSRFDEDGQDKSKREEQEDATLGKFGALMRRVMRGQEEDA